ncbi:MAG: 3-dehydroquinate synthase [Prevotella sp.]|nr:3-dehydroquinate synthase [Prevotella sp.]
MDEERMMFSKNLQEDLALALMECEHDRVFVLADTTTAELCWPVVRCFLCMRQSEMITIPSGDDHKTIATATYVWQQLSQLGATRHSCLINLGGGMVTDLGGFVAGTFKRGINYINMPTTLLAMVDASVGGKTGVNLDGLKNEVGTFSRPSFVIIHTPFLQTLSRENFLSGYAEMLKHALLSDNAQWAEMIEHSTLNIEHSTLDMGQWEKLLKRSVAVKQRIVAADPKEQGLRKELNLGHTVGHALETWSRSEERGKRRVEPLLHGYAVAYGLVAELFLSAVRCGFPTDKLRQTVSFIHELYGRPAITCDDYDALIALMRHDKKNKRSQINFALLADIGDVRLDQTATVEEIKEALDFLREG